MRNRKKYADIFLRLFPPVYFAPFRKRQNIIGRNLCAENRPLPVYATTATTTTPTHKIPS
jgi:hypothetical protein